MAETAMTHLVESTFADASLHVRHEIDPEGYLRPVEGRLFNQALGTVSDISQDDIISLVGCITEEIALEYGLCTWQGLQQLGIGVHDGLQLLGVGEFVLTDMYHRLIFLHFGTVVEAEDISVCILKSDM